MKLWLKIIIYGIITLVIVTLSTISIMQRKNINTLKQTVNNQQLVIDSLLNKHSIVFDVSLNVTDKSKMTVNGKGNSGYIYVPSERTYILEVDSTNISLKQ